VLVTNASKGSREWPPSKGVATAVPHGLDQHDASARARDAVELRHPRAHLVPPALGVSAHGVTEGPALDREVGDVGLDGQGLVRGHAERHVRGVREVSAGHGDHRR
jgi:hypothetical protein